MYEKIREKHPDVPYVMVNRPDFYKRKISGMDVIRRRQIILESFHRAYFENGDRNVYFIDGGSFFNGEYGDCATVDGTHPNDYGMVCMADAVANMLNRIV